MKRFFFVFSLLTNLLLAGILWFLVERLGGWKYALYKFRNDEAGLYTHRKQLFALLPEKTAGATVFLGDSQMQEGEWRELFGDSLPILNRGIVGDHVDGVWARLDDILRNRPAKIFLCVGVNDLLLGKKPSEIEVRYREIVQKIRREGPDGLLVLQSVLPVNNEVKKIGIDNQLIRDLNERIAQIAKTYALPYVDIYTLLVDANGNLAATFTDDGLHVNGKGYIIWKKLLETYVK